MESYFYRCPVCGFVHMVPAYWVDFTPPQEYEQEHVSMESGEPCPCSKLILQEG